MGATTFGSRFLALRKRAGLSAERFGELLGLHRNSVVGYERGANLPGIEIVQRLNSAGLDWVYALTGQTTEKFAADHIRWDLILEILQMIEIKNASRRRPLSIKQTVEILQLVYRSEVGRDREISTSIDKAMRTAA